MKDDGLRWFSATLHTLNTNRWAYVEIKAKDHNDAKDTLTVMTSCDEGPHAWVQDVKDIDGGPRPKRGQA